MLKVRWEMLLGLHEFELPAKDSCLLHPLGPIVNDLENT